MEESSGFEQDHQSHNGQEPTNDHVGANNDHQPQQHYPQSNYEQQQYEPAGPQQQPAGQFSTAHTAQVNFTYQNNPAQPPNRPYRPAPLQYHQQTPNPVYANPAHMPPGNNNNPLYNAGPAPAPAPQKAGPGYNNNNYHQAPVKYSYENNNGPGAGGYGPGPGMGRVNGFPVHQQPQAPTQAWSSGLFDCMNDPSNALITAFCPCITFGQVAEIIDNGHSTCATSGLIYGLAYTLAVPCLVSYTYRTKLRNMFGLTETPAPDFVTHLLCEWCAVCQSYRQLRDSGYDPAIGWEGNVAKKNLEALQRNQVQMTPPSNERMMA